ncbi:hypothetical protein NEOLEDRAFT_1180678 [Neolentinus lepideus HHB14362 ss-1]|uniref:Uncharacterized protein n=1 Tax=Neolentinus lepideus HHB14362 ss-1 TaxID=1314782 RepID=A0A165QRG3_9AGAM|nr:hypothetical protein NEOLEDRAFT_1180678 [Neolentinus lepideus HHB14362 ss-1]
MSIRELLSEPFGPYLDETFLADACKSTPSRVLGLKSLMLECRGKPTGLSEIEHVIPELCPTDPVRFRGILEIGNRSWLTPLGEKQLQEDIRRRYGKRSRNTAASPTLNVIYSPPLKMTVQVWIQGYKNMSASYLASDLVPNGLRLTSRDKNRQYEVCSMDIETYTRSELYLDRYRLLAAMTHIVKQDGGATEVQKRNIRWFVKGYLRCCAYPEPNKTRRLLFRKNDKDLLEEKDLVPKDLLEQKGLHYQKGLLKVPRLLRKVHRAEMYAAFAEHAEWIKEEQRARKKDIRIVDLDVWSTFIREAKTQRVKASRHGAQWGMPAGYYASDADEDEEESEEEDEVARNVDPSPPSQNPESQPEPATRKKRLAPPPPLPLRRNTKPVNHRRSHGPIYDSDFSPASSSYASSSSCPPSPSLRDSYPSWGFSTPRLGASLTWSCPETQCPYLLNMGKDAPGLFGPLGEVDLQKLSEEFQRMVFHHWEWHLRENGLEWIDTPKGCIVRRIADADGRQERNKSHT